MRRVIVDQMEALAELNRIVARHGRAMDTVTTAPEQTRRSSYRDEQQPAIANAARGGTTRAEQSGAQRGRVEAPPVAPAGQNANGPSGPAAGAAGGGGPGARGGWLSELLTRAAGDEAGRGEDRTAFASGRPNGSPDDRNVRHTIESLDSLSVDIARMIDHDAAAELWERYNRGERNVFTRRLYTMQGQKAFDEVRRRYKSDREFRQTVDRYIGEFERLLNEVARDDRGQVVARTYLTSETGKVYTMLAHAAGRFE
jgi:hypothetical protein